MGRASVLAVALLLCSTLIVSTTAEGESNVTSIVIDELGAFRNTNHTHIDESGVQYPVLYLMETYHLRGQLNDADGVGLAQKCLNIYAGPDNNQSLLTTVYTNDSGSFDWFSGDADVNQSQILIEPVGEERVGFWTLRAAFEPNQNTTHGCDTEAAPQHANASLEVPFLLKSRVDVLLDGIDAVQPEGVNCVENECDGIYAGGQHVVNFTLMHDRLGTGVANLSLPYESYIADANGVMISAVDERTLMTSSSGQGQMVLNISDAFCCQIEGMSRWIIDFNEEPFYEYSADSGNLFSLMRNVAILPFTDSDGDGLHDDFDQCTNSPSGAVVNSTGCSNAEDDDGDGVLNDEDLCPSEDARPDDADEDGCLDDTDGDGVANLDDACPSTSEDASVDASGCSQEQLQDPTDEVEESTNTVEQYVLDDYKTYSGDVSLVSFSPNGSEYASLHAGFCQAQTCFDDPTTSLVRVWNTTTGEELTAFVAQGHVVKFDWSPDGSKMAMQTSDNIVSVYDRTSGESVLTYMAARAYAGDIEYSPDGTMLAVVSSYDGDNAGRIEVYNADTGALVQRLLIDNSLYAYNQHFYAVSWSLDGNKLLVGGFEVVIEYDVSTWTRTRIINDVHSYVTEVAYSPDETKIATCIGWERYSPSLKRSGYAPSQVSVYDAVTGSLAWSYASTASCLNMAWSPTSEFVAFSHSAYDSDGATINVFHSNNGSKAQALQNQDGEGCPHSADQLPACAKITGIDWHPDGDYIVASQSFNDPGIYHWRLKQVPVVWGCTNQNAYNFNPTANLDDGSCMFAEGPVFIVSDWRDGPPAGYSLVHHEMMFENPRILDPNGVCYDHARSILGTWSIVNLADDWIIDGGGYGNKVYDDAANQWSPYDTLYKRDNGVCNSEGLDLVGNSGGEYTGGGYTGGGYGGGGYGGGDVGFPAITDSNGGMNFGCLFLCSEEEWAAFITVSIIVLVAFVWVVLSVAKITLRVLSPPRPEDAEDAIDIPEPVKAQSNQFLGVEYDIPEPVKTQSDQPLGVEEQGLNSPSSTPEVLEMPPELKPTLIGWLDDVD